MFAGKKSAQIREILISESAWEEMTCLFAPSIEVKKTRKSLGARKIGEELIIDMARYRAHPDCDMLICFVYDPDGWVKNPKGLISDLEQGDTEGKTKVVIAQF